jgi:NADH-quinone oxidoreductase subunit G
VVALTPFKDACADVADVMLPIAPFTETAGTFVNAEGRLQSFHGVVKPLGDTRPAWKVLRVLGNLLGLPGFDQETVEDVRRRRWATWHRWPAAWTTAVASLASPTRPRRPACSVWPTCPSMPPTAMVRRACFAAAHGRCACPVVGLPSALWQQLGLQAGARVRW